MLHYPHGRRPSGAIVRIPILLATTAGFFCLSAPDAVAQNNAASPTPDNGAPPLTQSAQAQTPQDDTGRSWTGETIVVTGVRKSDTTPDASSATRTDTPVIEIPQSVQVLTRTLLVEQDVRRLSDALVNVSGVVPPQPEEDLFVAPIIRGFPGEVYLDGLPLYAGPTQGFDPSSLVGVERIEVLKGPTSTLYGGGLGSPLGGLINIESERPADTFGGFVAMRAGSFSTWNPYGDLNVPLGSGVAARIATEYQSNGSWIDQVKGDRWSVQPSISFQIDPNTDLLLQGQFNHTDRLEYSGLPASQALAGQIDRYAFPGAPIGQPHTMVDSKMATATLVHAFTDDLKLTVSGRYYDSQIPEYGSFVADQPDPSTPTTYDIVPLYLNTRTKEGTFDTNLSEKADLLGGRHEFLAGIDYDQTHYDAVSGYNGVSDGVLDLAQPVYNLPFGGALPIIASQTDSYQTIAVYVQDQATYGRLHLTGSLRYTNISFHEVEQGTDQTYNHVSPRIGATVDLAPGVALFAGYATAFRAAFGFVGLPGDTPKPETSRNIEGGMKLALKSIGLSGTIAAFDQTHHNVATPAPPPNNLFYSIQTGQQRARGVEADLVWEPIPAFSLLANYAYTDATVTKDNNIPIGNELPRVPRNSGRIAGRYRLLDGVARGLSFGAGVTVLGSRQDTLPNTISIPGYTVVDAQAAYEFGRYTIEVSAVNLNGVHAFDPYEYLGTPVVLPIQPRSAYVTLKARL